MGFEPLRAEPNGFRVHLLGRSGTLSVMEGTRLDAKTYNQPESPCTRSLATNQVPGSPEQAGSWGFRTADALDLWGFGMRRQLQHRLMQPADSLDQEVPPVPPQL